MLARYHLNPGPVRERVRLYAKDHPEKVHAYHVNSKAKRRAIVGKSERITDKQYAALIARDAKCYLCGKANRPATNSLDHVTPLSKGGLHVFENFRIVHLKCNVSKSNKLFLLPFEVEPSDYTRGGGRQW